MTLRHVKRGHLKRAVPRTLAVIVVAVALPLTYAVAALADVPEGWSEPEDVSFMHTLLVLVGIPLLCMVLIGLAVYLPSVVRGESVSPAGVRAEDEWFGGRRDADKALEARGAGSSDETGGARGSW